MLLIIDISDSDLLLLIQSHLGEVFSPSDLNLDVMVCFFFLSFQLCSSFSV